MSYDNLVNFVPQMKLMQLARLQLWKNDQSICKPYTSQIIQNLSTFEALGKFNL